MPDKQTEKEADIILAALFGLVAFSIAIILGACAGITALICFAFGLKFSAFKMTLVLFGMALLTLWKK